MNENKKTLKKILITLSVVLGLSWVAILAYGIFVERPISINLEKSMGQTQIIDLNVPFDKKMAQEEKKREEFDKAIKELTKDQIPENNGEKAIPKISLVVTNLGTNKTLTEEALKLPKKITLGFSAYTTTLKPLFDKAISSGHDVLIYLPFEPKDYPASDPGPYAILQENPTDKNIGTIQSIIAGFNGIKGVYANYRESLSSNQKSFLPIVEDITQKNLLIFLGRDISNDSPNFLEKYKSVIGGNVVIDIIPDEEAIKHSLANLVAIAKAKGFAVGYINTYPVTIRALTNWMMNVESSEVEIVPISELNSEGR
jgi:polysaccharide deacetylase 2 family uncharacterized protein YibQ